MTINVYLLAASWWQSSGWITLGAVSIIAGIIAIGALFHTINKTVDAHHYPDAVTESVYFAEEAAGEFATTPFEAYTNVATSQVWFPSHLVLSSAETGNSVSIMWAADGHESPQVEDYEVTERTGQKVDVYNPLDVSVESSDLCVEEIVAEYETASSDITRKSFLHVPCENDSRFDESLRVVEIAEAEAIKLANFLEYDSDTVGGAVINILDDSVNVEFASS